MALKDWKKTVYHKKHITWAKSYSVERVEYYEFTSPKKYRIDITLKDGGQDFRVFKSKPQAISFAKNYMRNH